MDFGTSTLVTAETNGGTNSKLLHEGDSLQRVLF